MSAGIDVRRLSVNLVSLVLLVLLIAPPVSLLGAENLAGEASEDGVDAKLQSAIENLTSIQQSIELKRNAIRELREQLKQLEETSDKQEIEQKIERVKSDIINLQQSFDHITLNGVNFSVLADQPEQRIKWQDEIEQISRPILSTLKELTAKPRQMDGLRRDIERREDQLKVIEKALDSIRKFKQQALAPVVAEPINQLMIEWEQRGDDTQRALEIAQFKLAGLKTESETWQTSTGEAISEFFLGRGLTLLLATGISLIIWMVSRALLKLYWRWLYRTRNDIGVKRVPLVLYSYRLAASVIIILAILMVFYVRGDVLLLTLAVIALAGAALSLRQTLPRYTAEVRLLLGVGPVREQERLVLDGIPFLVESVGVFSVLRNPLLEGVVRLPLHALNSLTSRPAGQESWFPCEPEEYVVLANGGFGRVVRQTIEWVELAVLDSRVQITTKDFLSENIRNLSKDGFGIASTFGIDYQHQAICLDKVPERFREGIIARFEQAGLRDDIEDILVEFTAAGASSLDYRIYIILNGRAASAYFRAQRLVQQACVETCNREGWIIPFTQITVHTADDTNDTKGI
ncbi:MAG: hypothetical protein C0631_12400 [Sedimenticola sp.]|nr:MAG: hypothetical protein C0631_12400 [Sedimenticola sp.]